MIIECFPFFNEVEVLEIHLETTNHLVDRYIIVESNRTFRGQVKAFNLLAERPRYQRFWHKILYQPIRSLGHEDPWANEAAERNELFNLVRNTGCATHENTVILVDVDEIPNPEAVTRFRESGLDWMNLQMPIYNYYYNLQVNTQWKRPKILRGDCLGTAHDQRLAEAEHSLERGGWHFSNVMSPERFRLKHKSFSHSEADRDDLLDLGRIRRAMQEGEDLFGHGKAHFDPRVVPLDTMPSYIRKHSEKLKEYLVPDALLKRITDQ